MLKFGPQQALFDMSAWTQDAPTEHACNLFCGCYVNQAEIIETIEPQHLELEEECYTILDEDTQEETPPYWLDCDCPVCTGIRYSKRYAEPATPRPGAKRIYRYRCIECKKTYKDIDRLNTHAMTYHEEPTREELANNG